MWCFETQFSGGSIRLMVGLGHLKVFSDLNSFMILFDDCTAFRALQKISSETVSHLKMLILQNKKKFCENMVPLL